MDHENRKSDFFVPLFVPLSLETCSKSALSLEVICGFRIRSFLFFVARYSRFFVIALSRSLSLRLLFLLLCFSLVFSSLLLCPTLAFGSFSLFGVHSIPLLVLNFWETNLKTNFSASKTFYSYS